MASNNNERVLRIKALVLVLVIAIFFAVYVFTAQKRTNIPVEHKSPTQGQIELKTAVQATVPPILEAIALCESGGRQFTASGTVITSHTGDVGKWQISPTYWLVLSNQLGYDIYTEAGNTLMALYIYENYGAKMWSATEQCWGKAM